MSKSTDCLSQNSSQDKQNNSSIDNKQFTYVLFILKRLIERTDILSVHKHEVIIAKLHFGTVV